MRHLFIILFVFLVNFTLVSCVDDIGSPGTASTDNNDNTDNNTTTNTSTNDLVWDQGSWDSHNWQ